MANELNTSSMLHLSSLAFSQSTWEWLGKQAELNLLHLLGKESPDGQTSIADVSARHDGYYLYVHEEGLDDYPEDYARVLRYAAKRAIWWVVVSLENDSPVPEEIGYGDRTQPDLTVPARDIERILAFLDREDLDLEVLIDDDKQTSQSVDRVRMSLHQFAMENPEFDDENKDGDNQGPSTEQVVVLGRKIEVDTSGVGHCWIAADEMHCPPDIQEEIAGEIVDGYTPNDEFLGGNGRTYRWEEAE